MIDTIKKIIDSDIIIELKEFYIKHLVNNTMTKKNIISFIDMFNDNKKRYNNFLKNQKS